MKVSMSSDGTLTIEPEDSVEAFALKQWSEMHINHNQISTQHLIIYNEVGAAPLAPTIKRFGE